MDDDIENERLTIEINRLTDELQRVASSKDYSLPQNARLWALANTLSAGFATLYFVEKKEYVDDLLKFLLNDITERIEKNYKHIIDKDNPNRIMYDFLKATLEKNRQRKKS
jgi:hypothetical protein